jgi:drug/metabolite transporter (DMT)-like permease
VPATAPALLAALGAAVGWSLYDLFRRFLAGRTSAWTLVVWLTVPALPLIAAWGALGEGWRVERGYLAPAAASVALNLVANFLYFRAFQISGLSVTLPMLALTPVFSSILGALVLGEPLAPRAEGGIACVVAGAFLLATGGGRLAARVERGSLLMGLVALCWSATLLLDKLALAHASTPLHALVLNGGVAAGAWAVLAARGRTEELGGVRGSSGLLALAVLAGVGALVVQLIAIQSVAIGLVESLKRGVGGLLAVLWGRWCFGEPVTGGKVVAVGLLVAGVALILS